MRLWPVGVLRARRGARPARARRVWGAIVAWGLVVECETGFRAQFARPIGLLDAYNPLDFARPLKRARDAAAAYGVPLLARDELLAYAGWHGELHEEA